MANSKAVSIRIPDDLLALIDDKAEREYKTIKGTINRSLVILDIVFNYFNTLSNAVQKDLNEPTNDIDFTLSDNVKEFITQELKSYIDEQNIVNVTLLQNNMITLSDSVSEIKDSLDHHIEKLDSAEMRVEGIENSTVELVNTIDKLNTSLSSYTEQLSLLSSTVSDIVSKFDLDSDNEETIKEEIIEKVKPEQREISSFTMSDTVERDNLQMQLLNKNELFKPFAPIHGIKLSSLRFGLAERSLSGAKSKKTLEEFTNWTKRKDPDGIGWIPTPNGNGYTPEENTTTELLSRLQVWIEENLKGE